MTSISIAGAVHPGDAQGARIEVTLDVAAGIELYCDELQEPFERHRVVRSAAMVHSIEVHGLRAASRYGCYARPTDTPDLLSATVELSTAPLPSNLLLPKLEVAPEDAAVTGYTVFNYARLRSDMAGEDCYLVVLDALGDIRWYYALGECGGDLDVSYIGDGRLLYGGSAVNVHFVPTIVGLDKATQFVATWQPVNDTEIAESYHHDAGLAQDGTSLFTMTATNQGEYQGFVIKQIDVATSAVLWFWDSETDGVKKGLLPAGSSTSTDPYHANAVVDRWEDGRLYLYASLRDLNQVLKIDYASRTIVWRLGNGGDFTLFEPDGTPAAQTRWFSGQHDPKPFLDTLLIHDNGSTALYGSSAASRALRLRLDESTRKAWIIFEHSEPNWSEPAWGGYDMLPSGNSLIAMGHCWRCAAPEGHGSALVELSPEGREVWRAGYDDDEILLYRADRIDGCAIFDNETFCPKGD